MKRFSLFVLTLSSAFSSCVVAQERSMNVTQAPDTVFDGAVADMLPELEGASPTGENGRVGGELVFWGYTLADSRPVYLFACAIVPDVDCNTRIALICPGNAAPTLLDTVQSNGKIIRRRCESVAVAMPGEARPGCVQNETEAGLLVGVVSCG
jgi:hypothetical protein